MKLWMCDFLYRMMRLLGLHRRRHVGKWMYKMVWWAFRQEHRQMWRAYTEGKGYRGRW